MTGWRSLVSPWVPPAVGAWVAHRAAAGNAFTEFPGTWADALESVHGYADPAIIAKVVDATRVVERGEAAYERDSVLFSTPDYTWPLMSTLHHAAARDGQLSVLDFGGALGSTYRQHRVFLDDLPRLTWTVVEQPAFVEIGRREFQTATLRFAESITQAVSHGQPTVILLGSSLQYLERPHEVLRELAVTGARTMVIDRTPLSAATSDVLTIQRVPETIYRAAYPMWVLSSSLLLASLSDRWSLVARYSSPFGRPRTVGGLEFGWDGLILRR